jgi:hypothetical protein
MASRLSVTVAVADDTGAEALELSNVSEFDKHCETLLTGDATEGWASELRRYL